MRVFSTHLCPVLVVGIVTLSAVIVFACNDPVLSEGWWMATMSGVLFLVNSVVILFLPMMEYDELMQHALLT